ncbi:MAG TPA: 50S ribosomal protein L2 [Methylomirabilota bacterium]|nr:50S ribosomal protein L2 [Methylomirabilota bacterium]
MPLKTFRPLTPSTRYISIASFDEITKSKPEKSLVYTRKKTGGRNSYGRVTSRGRGQGHKQKVRTVDFRRKNFGAEATVVAIEYDPIRSARLALLEYKDGERSYILAPVGLQVGAKLSSGPSAPPELGNALPLKNIPIGLTVHNLEIFPGRGAQLVRTAGGGATLMSRDEGYAQVRLPSGEIRKFNDECLATIGQVGNTEHENVVLGKAGRARHRGIRPLSRGVAKNPVDHPMGGGAGKTSGGGHPVTPWGVITKGYKTRAKYKDTNRFIVVRRDGKPPKIK